MKKRKQKSEGSIIALVLVILLIPIGGLVALLGFQSHLKAYKNQILFLDPSWVASADYQGTNVVLADDNHKKLITMLTSYHAKAVLKEPNVTDTIHFDFTKQDREWTLDVSRTDKDCLKVDLVGDREYHVYIQETQYFDKFVELVSPEGMEVPNHVMGGR